MYEKVNLADNLNAVKACKSSVPTMHATPTHVPTYELNKKLSDTINHKIGCLRMENLPTTDNIVSVAVAAVEAGRGYTI